MKHSEFIEAFSQKINPSLREMSPDFVRSIVQYIAENIANEKMEIRGFGTMNANINAEGSVYIRFKTFAD